MFSLPPDRLARLALAPRVRGADGEFTEPDFVNTQAIYARVLCNTSAYPDISTTVFTLFDGNSDNEVCIIPAFNYVPLHKPLKIGVVKYLVHEAKDERSVFLGFQDSKGGVFVMPHHSVIKTFDEGDSLIIIKKLVSRININDE